MKLLVEDQRMQPLPIDHGHCVQASTLPLHHRDPVDRILVAQARVEQIPILTADPKISLYEVETLEG